MFVEGDGYATNPSVLTPINWDKKNHLCLAFHSYPPTSNLGNNGTMRTTYNIALWEGETGEQGPPYSTNISVTTSLNRANTGWCWWNFKKFNSENQPWNCSKTAGFQKVIDYWNSGQNKPIVDSAKKWLFDQAKRTNSTYCTFLPNMVSSLVPFNPNAVCVSEVQQPLERAPVSAAQPMPFVVQCRGGMLTVTMPSSRSYRCAVATIDGKVVSAASFSGLSHSLSMTKVGTGLFVVTVSGGSGRFERKIFVAR
jgi:hypothetical protein